MRFAGSLFQRTDQRTRTIHSPGKPVCRNNAGTDVEPASHTLLLKQLPIPGLQQLDCLLVVPTTGNLDRQRLVPQKLEVGTFILRRNSQDLVFRKICRLIGTYDLWELIKDISTPCQSSDFTSQRQKVQLRQERIVKLQAVLPAKLHHLHRRREVPLDSQQGRNVISTGNLAIGIIRRLQLQTSSSEVQRHVDVVCSSIDFDGKFTKVKRIPDISNATTDSHSVGNTLVHPFRVVALRMPGERCQSLIRKPGMPPFRVFVLFHRQIRLEQPSPLFILQ